MTSFRFILATSALLLASCTFDLKTRGGRSSGPTPSITGGGGGRPTASPRPAPRKGGYSEAQLDASYQRVVETYRAMTWGDLQRDDANTLFGKRAKPLAPPFFKIAEWPAPDAAWLPGWAQLASLNRDDISYQMLGQAAANRTWLADCHADFDRYSKGWKGLDAAVRPRLEAARRDANPYARIAKLVPLLEEVARTGTEQKLFLPARHPSRAAGLYYELVAAVFDTYASANATFHARVTLGRMREDVALMRTYGRRLRDADFEREAYCAFGQRLGTAKWQALPMRVSEREGAAYVRYPVGAKRVQELDAELKQLARASDRLQLPDVGRIVTLDHDSRTNSKVEPRLWSVHTFDVKKVTRKGAGLVLELERVRANAMSYDCISSNKVDRINADGRVEYKRKCRMGDQEHRATVVMTFAVAPPGADVRRGDRVHAFGDLDDKQHRVLVDRKNLYKDHTRYRMTGRWIAAIERGEKVVTRW